MMSFEGDTLKEYQQKLAAGGYELLRPLSTREEVQQLHVKLLCSGGSHAAATGERGAALAGPAAAAEAATQPGKRGVRAAAADSSAATEGGTATVQGPGQQAAPCKPADEPSCSGAGVRRSARRQQRQLQQQQQQQQVAQQQADPHGPDQEQPAAQGTDDDSCSQSPAARQAPQQQRRHSQQQQQQSSLPSRQPVSLQQPAATACSDFAATCGGPFKSLIRKVQPAFVVPRGSQVAASAAQGAPHQQSIAEVAAAAAAHAAAAATGGDHAAVAAAAAQAAAQAAAAVVGPHLSAHATQGPASASDGTDSSGEQEPVGGAMPTPGSFVKYQAKQVQQLWAWYTAPYEGGRSVQERESARPADIAWRQQQEGTRVLPGHRAAEEVDEERIRLGLDLPKYIKYLEGESGGGFS